MKILDIKPHTIIMTIGPSNCGKSFFCEKYLIPFLETHQINHRYFSSDKIRHQLLNDTFLTKHDEKMQSVSKQAFALLESGVDNYTQYPINTPVIIVDATHLSQLGRKNILEIAKKNNYSLVGIVFDYKNNEDYFRYVDASVNKRVIFDHVKTFKEKTMKELERDAFETLLKVDSNQFDQISIRYEDRNNYLKLPFKERICYVGDIHGCLDEFKQMLLDDKGMVLREDGRLIITEPEKYVHHVLVGDYIDKGPQIKETIEFLYLNSGYFSIVKGNHEYWVYEYLNGNLKPSSSNDELIATWFNTVRIIEEDEKNGGDLKQKFFALFNSSFDFIITDHSIVTHAPCENKYLGKCDKLSVKKQRNLRYPKLEDYATEGEYWVAKEEQFRFLQTEADYILPFHIFGHTMLKEIYMNKNKVCLDTGCVVGGQLSTALYYQKGQRKLAIKKYPSRQPKTEPLGSYFRIKDNEIDFSSLDIDLQKRVKWAAKNQLNFISGTMSPCDKLGDDLESLIWGLNYYKSKGVERVILQSKYMGSRATIRLHKMDVAQCKAFSRQGFEIKETRISSPKTMGQLFKELQQKYEYIFDELNAIEILLDGELLPWNVMGRDLIERDFTSISKGLQSELELLGENGFDTLWDRIHDRVNHLVVDETTKRHFIKERENVLEIAPEIQSLEQMKVDVDKYTYQVNLFGADAELDFKPFAILKITTVDGKESNCISFASSNIGMFSNLNKSNNHIPFCIVELADDINMDMEIKYFYGNIPGSLTLNEFWRYMTEYLQMEGVVIKPETVYIPGVAPYLKCRNKEYLRITYGPDYQSLPIKTAKLLKTKSIKRKIETSIKEWELGRKLSDIPKNEISIHNKKWIGLIIQLMTEQENESKLDPRL